MVGKGAMACPLCGGGLTYYDRVKRLLLRKLRLRDYIFMRRFHCDDCGKLHRELTEDIFPFKQYEAEIIRGVLEGFITSETFGFEDCPCDTTMVRWRNSRNLQGIL